MAAGVAYYAMLSLFPVTIGLLAVLSVFADSDQVQDFLRRFFDAYLPDSVDFVDQISTDGLEFNGWIGVMGLISLIWIGSAMISGLNRAINRAWGIHRDRSLLTDRPKAIALGVGLLLVFGASIFTSTLVATASELDVPALGRLAWLKVIGEFISLGLTVISFLLLYYMLPNTKVRLKDVIPAAVVAAIIFELMKIGFVAYLDNVARFEEIYGSIASLVVLMVWSYLSAFIIIAGAELAAVQIRKRQGLPPGAPAILEIVPANSGADQPPPDTATTA